ncbi:hypothetical protein HDU78_011231 [Chytriomyces hyalinus]|nr:hypothetical protein HDU78_011231 [Chytriomyces hyalinus]
MAHLLKLKNELWQGNPHAQNNLGICFEEGKGVMKDLVLAKTWYKAASDAKHANATNNLGYMLLLEKNWMEALKLFYLAWSLGSADAACNIATIYETGCDDEHGPLVDENIELALRWYREASEKDSTKAQIRLATLLTTLPSPRIHDAEIAITYLQKAVDTGSLEAMTLMGQMLQLGIGTPDGQPDLPGAFELFSKGALAGHAESLFNLANCFETGAGVERDYDRACVLFEEAARFGSAEALERIELLNSIAQDAGRNQQHSILEGKPRKKKDPRALQKEKALKHTMRGQNKTAANAHEFNKRTVHIPGSHALPPGINTNMAWEMGYSRKRLDSDTKGIENTVNHVTYSLGEKLDEASRSASDHARVAQAMSDSLHVSKGSDIRNLDTLNPYFMHLELIKRRYAVEGDALWRRMGAAGDDTGDLIYRESRDPTAAAVGTGTQVHVHANGRVPVGGWPSGLEFEMGVHFMPGGMLVDRSVDATFAPHAAVTNATISASEATASAAVDDPYVLRMLAEAELERDAEVESAYGHEQEAAEDATGEKGSEDGDKKDAQTESSAPAEEVKGNVPSFQQASSDERSISTAATTGRIIESEPKHSQEDNRPMLSSFSPFFPLPAVQSIATSNPMTLPQCYAVNRRYHSNPVHPDSLQDPAVRSSNTASPLQPQQLAIHAKYLDTYNTVALVNGRPTARAIPGTSAIPPAPSSGAKPLLPVYSRMANVPLTTSAIAAINGLGALGYSERFSKQASDVAMQHAHYRNVILSKGSNHPHASATFTSLHQGTVGAVLPPVNLLSPPIPGSKKAIISKMGGPPPQQQYYYYEKQASSSSANNVVGQRYHDSACFVPKSLPQKQQQQQPVYNHGYQPCLDAESAEKHWNELLQMDRPHGRRGWSHVGRDHLANFSQGLSPVTNFANEKSAFR